MIEENKARKHLCLQAQVPWCFGCGNYTNDRAKKRMKKSIKAMALCVVIVVAFLSIIFLSHDNHQDDDADETNSYEHFSSKLENKKSIRFGSRNGKIVGLDSDQVLEFTSNHKALLRDYSVSEIVYSGSFDIDKNGSIEVDFHGLKGKWPLMKLKLTNGSLLLYRRDGITVPSPELEGEVHFENYWPFGEIVEHN